MNLEFLKRVKVKAEELELKSKDKKDKENLKTEIYNFILRLSSEDSHD